MQEAYAKYLDSYRKICPFLKEDELAFIRSNLSISVLKKGEYFLKSGKIQRNMGYVFEGLLRSFYIDNEGSKVTISFISAYSYAADYPSFLRQLPSKYYIEALEPCTIVNLPFETMQEAYRRFKNFENYGRLVAEQILLKKQDRIESFLFGSAEDRYLDFIQNNSDIANRVSLSHLSSYLGIQRPSLSRIRKKLQA